MACILRAASPGLLIGPGGGAVTRMTTAHDGVHSTCGRGDTPHALHLGLPMA